MLLKILNFLFPAICINCNSEGEFLCNKCFTKIKITYPKPYIPCSFHKNPILRRTIHKFKYSFYKNLAKPLSKLLNPSKNAIIIPIPLHKKRLSFRGFNQAEELAKNLTNKSINLLQRTKKTSSQAKLNKSARQKNIKGSFIINPNVDPPPKSSTLILLDDVCTTFSTMNEAALTLKKNGYNVVHAMALAYSELKNIRK
jgi:ComF family protein